MDPHPDDCSPSLPGDKNEDTDDQHPPMPPKKALRKGKEGAPQNMAPTAPKTVKAARKLTLTLGASRPRRNVK